MYTDSWFLSGADDAVKLHKKYTKNIIYVYLFSHRGVESFTQIFGDAVNDYGNISIISSTNFHTLHV